MKKAFLLPILTSLSMTAQAALQSIADVRNSARPGDSVTIQGTATSLGGYFANLHDGTGGICVYDKDRFVFCKTGEVLRVTGTFGQKNGQLHIMLDRSECVGFDPVLAKPVTVSPTELLSAKGLDFRSVSVKGVVADAFRDEFDPDWAFFFFPPLSSHTAAAVYDPGQKIAPSSFIDAEVIVTGIYQAEGSNGRPYLGPHVVTFFADTIQTQTSTNVNLFQSPACSALGNDTANNGHRRCLAGAVLATWNGDSFFIREDNGRRVRIHVQPGGSIPPPGSYVMAAGFPCHNIFFTEFINAHWHNVEDNAKPPFAETPLEISPGELLNDNQNRRKLKYQMDGQLIRLRGKVLFFAPTGQSRQDFFLQCGNEPVRVEANEFSTPKINSEVEVTGICRFFADEFNRRIVGFSILPRTADDIKVIKDPPWWTLTRALIAILALILLVLSAITWNFILQKLVARKGRELARESLAHLKAELRVDERTALAVELHDTIAQNLTGVSMQMEGVDEAHRIGSPRLGELIGKARHALDSCRTELRNCLWDLRNDAFDSDDISSIIRKAIAPHLGSASADVKLDLQRSHISDSTFHALLCIIRELVINAVRHGKATQIGILGEMTEPALKITVRDNGRGFDPTCRPGPDEGHFGILGIQERLDRLGGTLVISSSPGRGAAFTITIES